jgi:hypothetical protein
MRSEPNLDIARASCREGHLTRGVVNDARAEPDDLYPNVGPGRDRRCPV